MYIVANPQNIEIFQSGRIVGRDDDNQHFGIIESVLINTDIENGDYLTVRGRFLMCLLERRIIHPTYNVTAAKAYSEIVWEVVTQNALLSDSRRIPGLSLGTVTGTCWEQTATLQISYTNLMQWVYTICEKLGGTANIRLMKSSEKLVNPKTASESDIVAHNTQYVYNRDYFVGDYVTVQHRRFGMIQPQIQPIGMIEGFDQNGRSLTPTFKDT